MRPRCPCAECIKQDEDSPLEKGGQNEDDLSPSSVSLGLFPLQCLFSLRFLVPISSVICNDITAYIFGFFFGRTPLIKVMEKHHKQAFTIT